MARKDLLNSDSPTKRYLSSKPEVEECYPFGDDVAVFKVRGKMFATFSLDFKFHGQEGVVERAAINLKCDPDQALALRDVFEAVIPGYHMNKKHWNTVVLDGSVPEPEIQRMIDHSYALVVGTLKRLDKQAMLAKYGEQLIAH